MDITIFDKIDKVDIVSFDIFDTLILRNVSKPTDVFKLIEIYYTTKNDNLCFNYAKIRVEAEKLRRQEVAKSEKRVEIHLDEIYDKMRDMLNISNKKILDELKEIEIYTEKEICIRNEYMYKVYNYCIEKKKDIIITSDMYLPYNVIETILHKNGYCDYKKLYISSNEFKSKQNGCLYNHISKDLGIHPEKVLHIGDNKHSDYNMAIRSHFNAYHYINSNVYNNKKDKIKINNKMNLENQISESIYNAIIKNKYFNENNYWYKFGYIYVGILYYGFIDWIVKKCIEDKIEHIYFFARDGYIMKKVYDIVRDKKSYLPESTYLYASRRGLNIPAISSIDDQTMNFLIDGSLDISIYDNLKRIGLNPEKYESIIQKSGFENYHYKIKDKFDIIKLKNLYKLLSKEILINSKNEKDLILSYLKKEKVFDYKKIGIVDIGWHGSLQKSFEKIIDETKLNIDVRGYYLGLFPKAEVLQKEGYNLSAYLFNFGKPANLYNSIYKYVPLIEFIFSAPHGSFIKFDEKINPILDTQINNENLFKCNDIQEGAIDFIKDFMELNHNLCNIELSEEFCIGKLLKLLEKPSFYEANMLGEIYHTDGFGENFVKYKMSYKLNWKKVIIRPKDIYLKYKTSYWKEGYIKRNTRIIDYYYIRKVIDRFKYTKY